MAVYDEEKPTYNPNKDYTPEELKDLEDKIGEYYDDDPSITGTKRVSKDIKDDAYGELRKRGEDEEEKNLDDMLGGYFTEEGTQEIRARANLFSRNKNARRALVGGVAVGVPAILFALAFLPSLLGLFKIENFLQNIDAATFTRFNASFDRRSDQWLKAYIKLRITEIESNEPGQDTLFFRANKVDTDNPVRDWYRTLRKNNFEEKVFEKNGIYFTSAVVTLENGQSRFKPGFITIRDVPLGATLSDFSTSESLTSLSGANSVLNTLGPDIDRFVDVELFDSDRAGRRAIKSVVNDNTKSWQVFKRRHLRKDIQNITGIRDWRLFETTRDKIDLKKVDLQLKILNKILPSDSKTAALIGCVFGSNRCPSNSDPASKDAQSGISNNGTTVDQLEPDKDADGNDIPNGQDPDLSGDFNNGIGNVADNAVDGGEVAETIRKQFLKQITGLLGNIYTKIWPTLKKLAAVDKFFSTGTLSKFALNNTRAQYMGAYATMAIALSQMKSGDIRGTEGLFEAAANQQANSSSLLNFAQTGITARDGQVNQYMRFFDDAERSEAWILYSGSRKGNSDSATAASLIPRDTYCTELSETERKAAPIHYLCPDQALNGGRAGQFEEAYRNTAGKILGPIRTAVEGVKSAPIIGGIIDFASSKFDALSDATIGKLVNAVLDATGTGDAIADVAVAGVTKALEMAGVGIKYTPELAGQLNFMMLGGSATAEASARYSGAAAATSLTTEYSNRIAAEWKAENEQSLSTYDKYASLSNPKSFASTALMAIATSKPSEALRGVADPTKSFDNFASALSGTAKAQGTDINASSVADWGGIPKYDFPQECIELDPLTPDYFERSTNAPASVPRDKATMTNPDVFWQKVYDALPDGDSEEALAATIYNCALLDQRVMGGLGYTSGYEADGGLGSSAQQTSTTTTSPQLVAGTDIPAQDTSSMPCPVSTTVSEIGVADGYKDGQLYKIKLCSVHGVQINAVAAKSYDDMFTAMKASGYSIDGTYGFRSMSAQESLYASAGPNTAARPGYSNHQFGTAVDISCNDSLNNKYVAGSGRGREDFINIYLARFPCLKWLSDNSANFGLLLQCNGEGAGGQEIRANSGGCEVWHMSPTGG